MERSFKKVRCAVHCPPSCQFITTKMASREQNYFPNERTKLKKKKERQTYKPSDKTQMDKSSMEFLFLLQSLTFLLRPFFTSHWGPSCWSPLQKQATPPWAGRTVTTHSNHSYRQNREAQGRRLHREYHGVPFLRHDHLCRKPVDRVHLREEVKQFFFVCPAEVPLSKTLNNKYEFFLSS